MVTEAARPYGRRCVWIDGREPDSHDLRCWVRRGTTALALHRTIHAEDDVLSHVRLLRDAAAQRIRVLWAGTLGLRAEPIRHLDLPVDGDDATEGGDTHLWCRIGPGFILIEREYAGRLGRPDKEFLLEDSPVVAAFMAAQQPVDLRSLDSSVRNACNLLEERDLIVAHGDHILATPARLQRWPHRP